MNFVRMRVNIPKKVIKRVPKNNRDGEENRETHQGKKKKCHKLDGIIETQFRGIVGEMMNILGGAGRILITEPLHHHLLTQ